MLNKLDIVEITKLHRISKWLGKLIETLLLMPTPRSLIPTYI